MRRSLLFAAAVLAMPLAGHAGPTTPKADPNSLIDHPAAGGVNVAGRWQVEGSLEGPDGAARATPVCDFQQTGGAISGKCKGPNAEGPASGVLAGKHVSWKWQPSPTTPIGASGTAWFQGDLGADGVIRGTWGADVLPGVKGEFTQTRK